MGNQSNGHEKWFYFLAAALFVLLLAFFWFVRHSLLLLWVSVIFAIVFNPAVKWIQRRHIGRWSPGKGTSLLLLILALALAFSVFLFFAVPPIIQDSHAISSDLPHSLNELTQQVRKLPFGNKIASSVNEDSIRRMIVSVVGSATNAISQVTGALSSLFMIVLLTCYFILEGDRSFQWALGFVPVHRRSRAKRTLLRARDVVQRWLVGQALLMLILGSSSLIVFWALGVRYFYVLGVFAGVSNFIPVLGPVATVIVAGVLAAMDSWAKVLGVIIFYLVYQQVENAYLSPKIVGSAVGLPGVGVLSALIIGTELAGLLGALVAVPTAALLKQVLDEYARSPQQTEQTRKAA
jgi:predicted PurR-regulated permease PerM